RMAEGRKSRAEAPREGPADVLVFPGAAPAPPRPLSLRRRVVYFAAPFLAFFLLLGVVEWTVRGTQRHLSTLEVFVQAPEQQRGFRDVHGTSVFEGDPLLFWRLAPNLRKVVWD